jgi:ATP-dependent protease ClpP protease subunit
MSMGAIILQAADRRLMHRNSTIMFHEGSVSMDDNLSHASTWIEFYKQQTKMQYRIMGERTGRTPRYWERRCTGDYILTADMALKEGLIDEICGWEG